jgi:hypothetical protein
MGPAPCLAAGTGRVADIATRRIGLGGDDRSDRLRLWPNSHGSESRPDRWARPGGGRIDDKLGLVAVDGRRGPPRFLAGRTANQCRQNVAIE